MDLEKIIDDLVYRKKNLDIDSPEHQLIDRELAGLRYSHDAAAGIIEDLDRDWGTSARRLHATPAQGPRQVLPFRRAGAPLLLQLLSMVYTMGWYHRW
jgi:hypothetical protein